MRVQKPFEDRPCPWQKFQRPFQSIDSIDSFAENIFFLLTTVFLAHTSIKYNISKEVLQYKPVIASMMALRVALITYKSTTSDQSEFRIKEWSGINQHNVSHLDEYIVGASCSFFLLMDGLQMRTRFPAKIILANDYWTVVFLFIIFLTQVLCPPLFPSPAFQRDQLDIYMA